MSRPCINCGNMINDNDFRCGFCGAFQNGGYYDGQPYVQQPYEPQFQPQYAVPAQPRAKQHKLSGAVIAVVSALIILLAAAAGAVYFLHADKLPDTLRNGFSFEDPIEKYFKAFSTGDLKYYEQAFPKFIMESEEMQKQLPGIKKELQNFYANADDISYDILNKTELSDADLKEAREKIKQMSGHDVDVEAGYEVLTEITKEVDGKEIKDTVTFFVNQVDGEWYIFDTK